MPLPQPNWQQHEHSHQHKQPRQYQPSSYEYHHDVNQPRERGRKSTRSGGKKDRDTSQREHEIVEVSGGTPYSRKQKRNGSYPDLAHLPPPEFRSLPHQHGDGARQLVHDRMAHDDRKHREKDQYYHATKGRTSTGTMRRSRTTSMSTPMEGVSRHQQTSSVAAEEDSQSRKYRHRPRTTPHYPTIPGDRVHFDTLEPYASKLHRELQHELKTQLGGRRRSRSVSLTSRERSLERNVRKDRHHQHGKKEREHTFTAERPISPPAQFSLPSTTYAAISSGTVIDTSVGRKVETQKLPPSQISRIAVDTKSKSQKASRTPQHHPVPSQIPARPKSPITSTKPSLQERYSSSFSSHQIPPPLPPQGSNVMQHKSKFRAKEKVVKATEEELDTSVSSHKRPQQHSHEFFPHPTSEDSLKHVCGLDSASLQFEVEREGSRAKIPMALKPQRTDKQRHHGSSSDFRGNVQRVSGIEPIVSETDSYIPEEKQKGMRGRDKSKHIILPATNGEISNQFAQSHERHKNASRIQHEEESPVKDKGREDRVKRRQRSKALEDEELMRKKMDMEEEQKIKREREERDSRIARRILEKQKEAKAKAINEKVKLEQDLERERLTAEMREKERIAKEMANQERKAIEKAERDRREKMKLVTKLQQERDLEGRSQRSRMGRDPPDTRLPRRLSKDVFTTASADTTYVQGEYVDNIDFASETTRLLMPPEEDSKRERSWDRKSRKSYDSAPPLEDTRSNIATFDDDVKRPSTMPDTKRPQSDSHKHKVIVHSKEPSSRSGRIEDPDIFSNGIITHAQRSHSKENNDPSTRPRSLVSLLHPPDESDQKTKIMLKEESKRRRRSAESPPCVCEHEHGGTPPESDSGNQETVLEVPIHSHDFQDPLTPTQDNGDEIDPHMHWDRRSRESKGSRATKTSQSARSQGYASLASSVGRGVSKTDTAFSRTEMYGAEDESAVESVDLCITTDDHPSMITPSVLGDMITTDDGRGSPLLTQYRPRSHSKSRHHKISSGGDGRERRSSGHRDHHHHHQQQRSHIHHQSTPKSQHRNFKHHHPEGSDLGYDSRCDMYGLESDYEIEQHVRNCRCPCDHMGHGNYLDYQDRPTEHISNGRAGSMEAGHGHAIGLNTSSKSIASTHPMLMRSSTDHFSPSSISLPPTTPLGPTTPASGIRREPFDSLLRGDDSLANKVQTVIISRLKFRRQHWFFLGCLCLVLVFALAICVPISTSTSSFNSELMDNPELQQQAVAKLLQEVPLIDGHNDLPWNIRRFAHNNLDRVNLSYNVKFIDPWSKSPWSHTDIARMKQGLIGCQLWVAYAPCSSQHKDAVQVTLEQIDLIKRLVKTYPNQLELVKTSQELIGAHKKGKIASLITIESGHSIGTSLAVLRMFHRLGARSLTLTHNCNTPWADCSQADIPGTTPVHNGLTQFGRTVVEEMNRLGMIVDLSHSSIQTASDTLAVSEAPVIYSHSSAYALCNSTRNVPDNLLKLVAVKKGLVMLNFFSHFLTCSNHSTVNDVIAHLNHIRKVAGIDHVGIGASYDGIKSTPSGLEDVSKYPALFASLLASGAWSLEDLKKLAGINFLRVFREVEKVSRDYYKQKPSAERIPAKDLDNNVECKSDNQ